MSKRVVVPIEVQKAVIIRDKCECQLCGVSDFTPVKRYAKYAAVKVGPGVDLSPWQLYNGPIESNLEFDHIKPVCFGGSNEADNIRLLCRACNRRYNWVSYLKMQMNNNMDYASF